MRVHVYHKSITSQIIERPQNRTPTPLTGGHRHTENFLNSSRAGNSKNSVGNQITFRPSHFIKFNQSWQLKYISCMFPIESILIKKDHVKSTPWSPVVEILLVVVSVLTRVMMNEVSPPPPPLSDLT